MKSKANSLKSTIEEIRKIEPFRNSTDEELLKIAEALKQFSVILFELYCNINSAKNEY